MINLTYKLPIGIQTLKKIHREKYLYMDGRKVYSKTTIGQIESGWIDRIINN